MANKQSKNLVAEALKNSMANLKKVSDEGNADDIILEIAKEETIIIEEVILDEPTNEVSKIKENQEPPIEKKAVIESKEDKSLEQNNETLPEKEQNKEEEKQALPSQPPAPKQNNENVVLIYNNPMNNLIQQYQSILAAIKEEENQIFSGFVKKKPQSELFANATIQIRRDIYQNICDYITDMRMGKTKVLNEIFMLGVQSFIDKYNIDKE